MEKLDKNYWAKRYQNNETGWDIGYVSTPIKEYIDQLEDKDLTILIPGGGNSYEAEYLFNKGFKNVFVIDLAEEPLNNLKKRIPNFPPSQLIQGDFFDLNQSFDLVIEQTFFCAINPILREKYVAKMYDILNNNGKIVGLMFKVPLNSNHPPFGGNKKEYQALFNEKFHVKTMETAYNSIPPREDKELFINLVKK